MVDLMRRALQICREDWPQVAAFAVFLIACVLVSTAGRI
jgi:hypothetical protein